MANQTAADSCLQDTTILRGKLNVWGLVGVIAFYLVIMGVGAFAAWWQQRRKRLREAAGSGAPGGDLTESEDVMLAGRDIGIVVGIFTMTATWVGGGYINGTAEYVFNPDYGLIWTQGPVGYAISLFIGGSLFARRMRDAGYVTMLDPFLIQYGRVMTALLYLPALMGDIFWTGAILSALGASLTVIIGLNRTIAIIVSAVVSVFYTFIGGLFSVAFTDVIQLSCIFIGLWLAIPFAIMHPATTSIAETAANLTWIGPLSYDYWITDYWAGNYIDSFLLLIFGGIPWQVYFQRVLSQRTSTRAVVLSYVAAFGCLLMAIPAVIIGAIGASTDWNATGYAEFGTVPVPVCDYSLILPMVMQYLTPTPVAVIGLGAVSAAVMSSADSSVLSSASMFARNVYRPLRDAIARGCRRPEATEREVLWVMRFSVILVGAAAAAMGILVSSIYGLWFLCSDLIYVILFPQLVCVLYMKSLCNAYGSFFGFIIGVVLRFTGGEALLGLPPVIEYPWYDPASGLQRFPFKTLTMLITLVSIILFSLLFKLLARNNTCRKMDSFLFDVFKPPGEAVDSQKDFEMPTKSRNEAGVAPLPPTSGGSADKDTLRRRTFQNYVPCQEALHDTSGQAAGQYSGDVGYDNPALTTDRGAEKEDAVGRGNYGDVAITGNLHGAKDDDDNDRTVESERL